MLRGSEIKQRALELASRPEQNFLQLAKYLRMLNDADANQFMHVVDRSGLGRRKAYYLVEIDKRLDGLNLSRPRLQATGWTKLQVIGEHLTRSNAEKLLRLAEKNTAHNLKLRMRGEKPRLKTHAVLMYFSPGQYRQFEEAILCNGGDRHGHGLINKERALIKVIRKAIKR
jgi:hypothetical protein